MAVQSSWTLGTFALVLIANVPAAAVPVTATTSFNGDDFFFTWDFSFSIPGGLTCCPFNTIDLSPQANLHPKGFIAGLNTLGSWGPSAKFTQPEDRVQLEVKARHVRDPHVQQLGVNGDMVTFTVADILQLDVTPGAGFTKIDSAPKNHTDSVGKHKDIYNLSYRRTGADDWIFRFDGHHVPEPGTLAMFGVALTWLGLWQTRRRYSRTPTGTLRSKLRSAAQ